MKHFHYLAALALGSLMLASCTNDEVISSPDTQAQPIAFKAMANKSTRGIGTVNTDNLDVFRVWGCNMATGTVTNHVQSFAGVPVTKETNEETAAETWTYDNVQYWAPNRDYYFVALSTNTSNLAWDFKVPESHDTNLNIATFKGYGTVTMDLTKEFEDETKAAADRDLVYAYNTRTTGETITNETALDFTFNHMLSRIGFTFVNAFTNTNYTFKVSNIQLSGLINKGQCTLGNLPLSWSQVGTDMATVKVTSPGTTATSTTPIKSTTGDQYKFIIPGSQNLALSFNVTVYINNVEYSIRTLNGTIANATYEPGKSYMLTATISEKNIIEGGAVPIEFTLSEEGVNAWTSGTPGTVDLGTSN